MRGLATRVLEKVEVRPTRIAERNYLAIHYCAQRQLVQSIENVLVLAVKGLSSP